MKKILITIFLFFAIQTYGLSFNPNLSNMLQDTLNYYVAALSNIKGMSASVYYPGQGIWKGTSGVSYTGQPITPDMEFGIASNSKLFVSTAILKLTDNNILSLDDSLHEWLPTYSNVNPNITIRQLLQHTSGVSDPIFVSPFVDTITKNPTRYFTPQEVLSYLGAPQFSPGASFYYSNVNYILAGMVAESATGFHISRIIRDSILTPLNLDSTFMDIEETVLGTIAHRWYNSVDYHDTSRVALNSVSGGAGAIFSTSSEMAQWYHALFSGQILDSNSFAELTHFIDIQSAFTYGLGLQQQAFFGHNTWGHGGRTWGYKSRMVYDPVTGAVVCGLTNSDPSGVDGVTLLLYKVLVDHLPAVAGTITGRQTVCQGENSVTYSVPTIANANSYTWSLPNGASGTSSTSSIIVNYGVTAVSGNVTVAGTNTFGDGTPSSLAVKVNSIYNINENQIICEGDSISWHGNNYSTSGTYTANYSSINGCDSIYKLNLIVTSPYYFSEEHTICEGDTLNWHGQDLTSSNTYTARYSTIAGCDSVYTLNLKVNPSYHFNEEHTICDGETYNWRGNDCYNPGIYHLFFTTTDGCDSIYSLNLKVNPAYHFVEEHSMCLGEAYTWHGEEYFETGKYQAEYTSINGCDSIYSLNLTVNPIDIIVNLVTICKGETYNWHGNEYSNSGKYRAVYTNINGCDSTHLLNLTVDTIPTGVSLNGTTASADSIADTYQWLDCDNQYVPIWDANNQSFTPSKSGNYAVRLTRKYCSDTSDCVQITISDVENISLFSNEVFISPNPASDFIVIQTNEISDIKIYNYLGECVKNLTPTLGHTPAPLERGIREGVLRVDVSDFSVGIYYIRIGGAVQKFIKL